ncbi:MAG: hypothetical protein HRU30_05675, partial [Rhodobacteraceae bacterium]|nr:hypothetical protein [Paracoccaceae bacterium]
MNRRLAAILAADMVGYSRLMHADELGTLERQKRAMAEVFKPGIAAHRGRLVKTTGDGLLVEFSSAMDAVMCAVALQRDLTDRAARDDDAPLRYRIGINLGEIIDEDGDIFGDGVNVAARLEALAEPDGICISESVFATIKGKLSFGFERMGAHRLKNIAEPVTSYAVLTDEREAGKVRRARRRSGKGSGRRGVIAAVGVLVMALIAIGLWFGRPPSEIALPDPGNTRLLVMPVQSEMQDTDLYAEAARENLWRSLGQLQAITMVPRSASLGLEGVAPTPEVLEPLGRVTHILDATVTREGDDIALSAQLRRAVAPAERAMWDVQTTSSAATFFEELAGIRADVLAALKVTLSEQERADISTIPTRDAEAYALYARGAALLDSSGWSDSRAALDAFEQAAARDPNFVGAKLGAAEANFQIWRNGWNIAKDTRDALDDLNALVNEVLETDPNQADALSLKVLTALYELRRDDALSLAQGAVFRNPDAPRLRYTLAFALLANGDREGAAQELDNYRRMAPRLSYAQHRRLLDSYLRLGDLETAFAVLEDIRRSGEADHMVLPLIAELLARRGDTEPARDRLAEYVQAVPFYNLAWSALQFRVFKDPNVFAEHAQAMKAAGAAETPYDVGSKIAEEPLNSVALTLLFGAGFKVSDATDPLGEPYELTILPDGTLTLNFSALETRPFEGQWEIEGDRVCFAIPGIVMGYRYCDAVYPDAERWREDAPRYVAVNAFGLFRFGVA